MDVKSTRIHSYMASNGSCFMVTCIVQQPSLGGRSNTKPGDEGTPNGPKPLIYSILSCVRTRVHWNSMWLRIRSHMTSHCTRGSMTTLHDVGGVLGRHLTIFFRAHTILWSQLLPCVGESGPWYWERQIELVLPNTTFMPPFPLDFR